ncbi:LOW QUALITY PROTEIN: hypothetical protein TorRG33x02_114170, partial [Trema orientale]
VYLIYFHHFFEAYLFSSFIPTWRLAIFFSPKEETYPTLQPKKQKQNQKKPEKQNKIQKQILNKKKGKKKEKKKRVVSFAPVLLVRIFIMVRLIIRAVNQARLKPPHVLNSGAPEQTNINGAGHHVIPT